MAVLAGVPDNFRIARCKQNLSQSFVLSKLRPHSFKHHFIFYGFPVVAEWALPVTCHARGDHWRLHPADLFLMRRADEFLRLKIMLTGRPNFSFHLDRMRGKVGEAAVLIVDSIKPDYFHCALSMLSPTLHPPQWLVRHLSSYCRKSRVQRRHKFIHVIPGRDQRRPQPDHVPVQPALADQHSALLRL